MILARVTLMYAQQGAARDFWDSFAEHVYGRYQYRSGTVFLMKFWLVAVMVRSDHIKSIFVPFIAAGTVWLTWATYNQHIFRAMQ